MDGRLNRREAEQYLYRQIGVEISLVEEKYTYQELDELVKDLNEHGWNKKNE